MHAILHAAVLVALLGTVANVSAVTIELTNGDKLSGEISSASDDAVTLRHPLLGELTVPRSQIAKLQPDPADETATTAGTAVTETDDGLLGTGWLSDWKRRVEIGVTGAAGKSENQEIQAGFSADYEGDDKRWAHKTRYYRNEANGDLSDHSLFSTLNRDWLNPGSPWFEFAGGRFDWDELKDWDYRLTANGGVGYDFVKTDDYRLLGRAGLGANQTFGGDREEFTFEGLLGIDVQWKVSPNQTFAFVNTLHPSFQETGEYRNLTTLDWVLDLDQSMGMALKISLSNEYDSLADDEVDSNDFKYTGSLVWDI